METRFKGMRPVMYRSSIALAILAAVSLGAPAAPALEQQASFFAGVYLLDSRKDLSDSARAAYFRTLETASGIDAATARDLLAAFRSKPEEWKLLYDRILRIVSEAEASAKKPQPAEHSPNTSESKRR